VKLLVLIACLAACRGDRTPSRGELVSEELLVPLALAKACHHKSKLLAAQGDLAAATAALRPVLALRFPASAPEGEDVRLDARARLAELLLAQHASAEALRMVTEGLAEATRESFFVANLYTVEGEVLEARGERRAANAAYDQSNAVIERLQRR